MKHFQKTRKSSYEGSVFETKNFYVKKEYSETRKSVFEGFDMITCRNVSIFRALDYILDTTRNNFSDSLF